MSPRTSADDLRARLGALCAASLAELRAMQAGQPPPPEWGTFSSFAGFPFIQRLKALAAAALDAGAPEHYQRLRKLADHPWSRARHEWRLTEIIAAVAQLGLWCQPPEAAEPAIVKRAAPPAGSPGRRLRGGREIMEAIEGAYSYARWRAFKREALKFNAPVEWPAGRGQPLAFENPLKVWLAARAAAAEEVGARREGRRAVRPDPAGRPEAYTGGDDQPLGLSKRPKGRNAPGNTQS
jgi:hypothetical protein